MCTKGVWMRGNHQKWSIVAGGFSGGQPVGLEPRQGHDEGSVLMRFRGAISGAVEAVWDARQHAETGRAPLLREKMHKSVCALFLSFVRLRPPPSVGASFQWVLFSLYIYIYFFFPWFHIFHVFPISSMFFAYFWTSPDICAKKVKDLKKCDERMESSMDATTSGRGTAGLRFLPTHLCKVVASYFPYLQIKKLT